MKITVFNNINRKTKHFSLSFEYSDPEKNRQLIVLKRTSLNIDVLKNSYFSNYTTLVIVTF